MSVLDCLFNTVTQILRKNVDKKALFDNLEVPRVILVYISLHPHPDPDPDPHPHPHPQVIMLAMDEMIDGGIIMECDPTQVRGSGLGLSPWFWMMTVTMITTMTFDG